MTDDAHKISPSREARLRWIEAAASAAGYYPVLLLLRAVVWFIGFLACAFVAVLVTVLVELVEPASKASLSDAVAAIMGARVSVLIGGCVGAWLMWSLVNHDDGHASTQCCHKATDKPEQIG